MARQPKPETAAAAGAGYHSRRPAEAEAGGILTIDLGAIFDNYRALAVKVMPTECAAVVKGDAYGCGLDQVTATLSRAGCKTFFVAHLDEARRVRAARAGGRHLRAQRVCRRHRTGLRRGLCAAGDQFLGRARRVGPVRRPRAAGAAASALHVDTGMNRLGLSLDETAAVADAHADRKTTASRC